MPDPLKCGFDADLVVCRSLQTLLAAEILFRRLHRDVAEQELDLLQFASGCVTQACTGPAEVVWRDFRQAELCGIFLHDMPDDLLCHAVAPGCSGFANAPKQFSTRNCSCIHPFINSLLDPVWNRNSPDVACLAYQIDYRPMIFTALKVVEKELSKFTAAKPAT